MESRDGLVSSVRACTRCIEFVNNGDHSQVDQKKRGRIEIVPDATFPSADPPGKALTSFLYEALQTSSGKKRASVMSVIRHLINQEKLEADSRSETSMSSSAIRLTDDVKEYTDALDKGVLHVETLPVEKCVLANSNGRNYPLNTAPEPTVLSKSPIPSNEQERIAAIEKGEVLSKR
ncbi:hypothetical protein F443_13758 [Plasmopara halstedii]|uniref:Uncharacterized protein n=1 Tax=Plasmopara halstedii TaxID=4781 RepID=A0A0N7L7I0_PLAHL|nr:hypothetical protein F443_13758 [Plasmopara halstedii]CEG47131.1 hypothetical protein F443_13758 [Plasmopara halstedii]|eukprot:XP_024583500.1 hypothetical protein F443_13758 [Plasmopara halstedii]